ncbi:MAG: acyl carrier protein [Pseudobacteriovorax sp.]|nr:acyl carrier protein [Pseudobacteriovorax sp.]
MLAKEMTQERVGVQLRGILRDVLNLDESITISSETNLFDIGLVSINVVELLSNIEESFDFTVEIEDVSPELFTSFGALDDFVKGKI